MGICIQTRTQILQDGFYKAVQTKGRKRKEVKTLLKKNRKWQM
jgi:hypothetical protein